MTEQEINDLTILLVISAVLLGMLLWCLKTYIRWLKEQQ